MEEFVAYLDETLGLKAAYSLWCLPSSMPIFLRKSAEFYLCSCAGTEFVVAVAKGGESLPGLKRIVTQTQRHTSLPVVLVSADIDPRQRRALVSQGIAFTVPYKHVYLPFLAFAAKAEAARRLYSGKLSARAQAALVSLISHPEVESAQALREVTGMSAATTSRVVDELAQLGLIERGKLGRSVVITYDCSKNALLHRAMPLLRTPVERTVFVRSNGMLDALPAAGESALAERSMLSAPRIAQKAASKAFASQLVPDEVLQGELPDEETVELQVWKYDPLIAGLGTIDNVSLGASLRHLGDERIALELDGLFGEDGLWQ